MTAKKIQEPQIVVPEDNSPGAVKVHESVVSAIVRKSVLGVKGVVRLAGSSIVDNIAEIVGSRKIQDRAISVEMGENSVAVEVKIIVEYGAYIPEVAKNVQTAVSTNVNDLTGMPVSKVNVTVMDIEEPEPEEKETPAEDDEV